MWFLWACYVCIAVGLLCYVRQMVFTGRMEEVVVRLSNTSQLQPGKVSDNPTETAAAPIDIFDFCPFEPPDPWDKTIVMYLNDKYGFISNCTAVDNLQPVTDLASGKVLLKKGKEKFQWDAIPSRGEKLAERIAIVPQDFELRQLEINEVRKLEVVEGDEHKFQLDEDCAEVTITTEGTITLSRGHRFGGKGLATLELLSYTRLTIGENGTVSRFQTWVAVTSGKDCEAILQQRKN
ncbi:unnamed protein product [Heligmosomoides polygyrus]|uniref:Conserved secreted protein n=1 Tax=Heligmosomoides polygyrus TaxID=6339 RepID=A0A3P8CNL9_HELPZ|nr:unnamed protein product [Heligmosomoides polygyrus]